MGKLNCELYDKADTDEKEDLYDGLCETGRDLYFAALLYYVFSLMTIMLMVQYIIQTLSIVFGHDSGNMYISYFLCVFYIATYVTAFILYYVISGVKYDNDCKDNDYDLDEKIDLCAGTGAPVSVAAVLLTAISGIVGIWNTAQQDIWKSVKLAKNKIGCCSIRGHAVFLFFLFIVIHALSILSLVTRDWVNWEVKSNDHFHGSLFTIDKYNSVYDYGYDCVRQPECDKDDDSTLCKTFDRLMDAGSIFIQIEVAVLMFNWFWASSVTYLILFRRDYAWPFATYMLPQIAWIVQLAGLIAWTSISDARYETIEECDNDHVDPDDPYLVCVTYGPFYAIGQLGLQVFTAIYFTLVYYERQIERPTYPAGLEEDIPEFPLKDADFNGSQEASFKGDEYQPAPLNDVEEASDSA